MNKENVWHKKTIFFSTLLIFGIGIILRAKQLSYQSLWYDELHSIASYHAQRALSEVLKLSIKDNFPPLYNVLLWLGMKLSNDHVLTGRFLSCAFGSASLMLFYKIGKFLKNEKAALFTLLIASTNPFLIYYSQEGRPYALCLFLSLCSFLYLLKFLENKKKEEFYKHIFFTLLALHTHLLSLLLIAHAILSIFTSGLLTKNEKFSYIKKYCIITFTFSPMILVLILNLITQSTHGFSRWNWMKQNSFQLQSMKTPLSEWFGSVYLSLLAFSVLMCTTLISIKNYIKNKTNPSPLAISQIFFLAGIIVLSLIFRFPLTTRYFYFFLSLFIIHIASYTSALHKMYWPILTLYFIFSSYVLFSVANYYRIEKKHSHRQALYQLHNKSDTFPIACASPHPKAFKLYANSLGLNISWMQNTNNLDPEFYILSDSLNDKELTTLQNLSTESWRYKRKLPRLNLITQENFAKLPQNLKDKIDLSCAGRF